MVEIIAIIETINQKDCWRQSFLRVPGSMFCPHAREIAEVQLDRGAATCVTGSQPAGGAASRATNSTKINASKGFQLLR